ncbi:hypothetical protein INS49_014036 [Diaporthe citri]|uniref:uncharacterized protein n=1 Tax=Diaporthe citri TaxID=83186 RepID=UPI001C7ECE03|nr:uncharacterized protein INS49_014036 [Diaporthe citri]KAG6358152.1 hypothetical protein INS49_014036 [Diaporthe citri]
MAQALPIDQSYTGPLHRVRVLLKQSGQDNSHLTVCNSASDPVDTELDAITQTILGQHVRVGLLAATQDHLEIKCSFASGQVACEVYFDPSSDDVLLFNTGRSVVQVQQADDIAGAESLPPEELKLLSPALWFVSLVGAPAQTVEMLVRPRHYSLSIEELVGQSTAKRPGTKMLPSPSKRSEASSGAAILSTMAQSHGVSSASAEPPVPPNPQATIAKSLQPHQLAQTKAGQRIVIKNTDTQETEYTLKRLGRWVYSRTHTDMFTAVLRNGESSPTVAVLMPKLWEKAWRDLPKRELYAAVHTANSWWKRYDMMVNLRHVSLHQRSPGWIAG